MFHSNCCSSRSARRLRGQAAIEKASPSAGSLRGQAAMEYLVTYGWALLALFFVIALLIGSGAFSVNNFSTPECTFQPDMPCSSFIIYKETGAGGADQTALLFNISNGLGFPINITNVSYAASGMGRQGMTVFDAAPATPIALAPGGSASFGYNFTGASQPSERDFKTVFATLTFYNCKTPTACTGPYVTSGRVSSIVERRQAVSRLPYSPT